jgi:Co/Zn/Cd efflux system component
MGAGHDHGAQAAHAGARHRGRLVAAVALLAVFTLVEAGFALGTGSLALLSDAGHMFTDVLGIAMALAAISAAGRAARDPQRTFGLYRLEVLAALGNALLLTGVALYVLIEAVRRFTDPPTVPAIPMFVVALGGLAVNLVAFALLRSGARVARRHRRRGGDLDHAVVVGRPGHRRSGRAPHPAAYGQPGPGGDPDPGPGRTRAPRRDGGPRTAGGRAWGV